MKPRKQILHHCLEQAKQQFKLGNLDKARDQCDFGIAWVATKKLEGMGGDDLIEDIRINLWLERFWLYLENNNLLL
jgi:hypothetical protein